MLKMSLNGQWQMSGNGFNCNGEIPGSVYSFLLDNKLIEDPFYRANELDALKLMDFDYEFTKSFSLPQDFKNGKIILHCDGLDTLCNIFVNGKKTAFTDNMHRRYEFDITELLTSSENQIKLQFLSPNKYIKEQNELEQVPSSRDALLGFSHIRKAHCMMGWDWGPRLPDAGIWRDIYLLCENSSRISDIHILQRHENGKVFVTPNVTRTGNAEIRVTITAPDGKEMQIAANRETELENPQLWWPVGLGEQPLYTFCAALFENGKEVDSQVRRIGLRTLKLIREKDKYGESFCHEVNGVRFFAMGGDYIPEDNVLKRITESRTRALLTDCRDCNFNAVRVWGGGYYPDDYFFDICDELGLVVFQDMMFACTMVSLEKPEFLQNILSEIEDNLARMRHHASIAVISGNNEIECCFGWAEEKYRKWYLELFEDKIPEILKRVAPELPYIPSSPTTCGHFVDPTNDNYGDCHYWDVWHGNKPFTEYRKHFFRYLSEFGFESFPSEKTVNSFTLPSDRNIFSRIMEMHQRNNGGNKKILAYLADTFRYPQDFSTLLYASQLLQAEAIRYGVEHFRRNRGRSMGTLYWQINDIWPVASWASIDYFGRYKALQYVAKRFYSPVLISCLEVGEIDTRPVVTLQQDAFDYETTATLCVTNDTLNEVKGVAIYELTSSDGKILESGKEAVTVPPLSAVWLKKHDFCKTDVLNSYMSYRFVSEGQVVSSGSVLFTAPKYFEFKDPQLEYSISGDEITVTAKNYAKYVEIDSPDSDFVLSDNYFDMNPGKKTVKILRGMPKTIALRSVYDIK